MWSKFLHIGGWSAGVVMLFVLLGASVASYNHAVLADVAVDIDFGEGNFFIEETEVREVVSDLGYHKDSTAMIDVDLARIKHALENNPFIYSAKVYEQLNGVLNVDIDVRQPILRLYTQTGQSVYLDEQGKFMPLSKRYTARTPIANGFISLNLRGLIGQDIHQINDSLEHPDLAVIRELYQVVLESRKEEFWKAQFNQYFISQNQDIEIIPRVGDHVVIVGDSKNIDKKFKKLRLFYDKGLNKTGWNEYKTINLKYANQVVCSKS